MTGQSVAVIIITRNRTESLRHCLSCIANQTRPAQEVIVVDSSGDTGTRDLVRADYPSALYIHVETRLGSLPTQRNIALSHVKSDIVAVTDDDGFARPEWIAELLECHGPGVGAVGGRILQGAADEGRGLARPIVGAVSPLRGSYGNFNVMWPEPFEVSQLQGTNMSFPRETLARIGGWDPTLESGYAAYEDTDVCLRVRRLGRRIIYNPRAIVQHGLEPREGGFGRDPGLSPRLAYSVSRNVAYTVFRNYRLTPGVIRDAGILAPIVNIARAVLPKQPGASRRSISFSPARWKAAGAIAAGHLAGLCRIFRSEKPNAWPRLEPP